MLLCIPKILKNESNSQLNCKICKNWLCCCVSQRYWKMKAIHNTIDDKTANSNVVVYPKDTEKWKQFTTRFDSKPHLSLLLCIPKILKNESNSQQKMMTIYHFKSCCVSQRYWKMKAIHNLRDNSVSRIFVVVYPKDTEKWKQFTTKKNYWQRLKKLFCIPKILKNESNSQQ